MCNICSHYAMYRNKYIFLFQRQHINCTARKGKSFVKYFSAHIPFKSCPLIGTRADRSYSTLLPLDNVPELNFVYKIMVL